MNLKNKFLTRNSVDEESARDSVALPRFSFEGDDRPLVSTERLFREWDEDTEYDPGCHNVNTIITKEQDIIVCTQSARANIHC